MCNICLENSLKVLAGGTLNDFGADVVIVVGADEELDQLLRLFRLPLLVLDFPHVLLGTLHECRRATAMHAVGERQEFHLSGEDQGAGKQMRSQVGSTSCALVVISQHVTVVRVTHRPE